MVTTLKDAVKNSGLTERDLNTLFEIFSRYPEIKLVHLFGSRAKSSYRAGSDVDLAVMNEGVSSETLRKIKGDLEESSLPYIVDLVSYPLLDQPELKEHIDRVGVELYKK